MTRASAQRIGRIASPIITLLLLFISPLFLLGAGSCVPTDDGEEICTGDITPMLVVLAVAVAPAAIATALCWTRSRRIRKYGSPFLVIVGIAMLAVVVVISFPVIKLAALVAAFGMFANIGPRVDPPKTEPYKAPMPTGPPRPEDIIQF